MSCIKPFRAVYYNADKIKDLTNVVCPPYDVISEEEQNTFHNVSPYNFIHILLGKDKETDDRLNNKYTRAKKIFNDWLKKGVLLQDQDESVYFYKQDYTIMGQKYGRLGFISLMKLQNEEDSNIYPHENTHSKAVEDRLRLWRSLKANLSSIFVCFSDKQKKIEKIFNRYVAINDPIIDIEDNEKVRNRLWRLHDPDLIHEIDNSISGQQLFIADGHHRYKVALMYQQSKTKRKTNAGGPKPSDYVMTYFTNIDSKDLIIFPMHRIVRRFNKDLDFLEQFFRIDKVSSKEDLLIFLTKAGRNEHAFGLYTREGIKLLRLRNKLLIDKYVKEGSGEFRNLDATILKFLIFDRVGIKSEDILYTKDLNEATQMVDNFEAQLSFILNPVKISQLKAIALNGERMPPKTTYFYPKVLSGLTVYKME